MADMGVIRFRIEGDAKPALNSLDRLRSRISSLNSDTGRASSFNRFGSVLQRAGRSAEKSAKSFSKMTSALGRVAFYRVVRSAIKGLEDAFNEGLQNAYAFSAGLSNAIDGRIATALDGLTASANTMKNQLGAAFGSLITAIAPVINTLLSLITSLATAITQLFAAFTGGTFLKAKNTSAKFADNMKKGAGSAKEWRNQLMGFDEINRLEDQAGSGGGGGASGINPNDLYDVVKIDSSLLDFVGNLKAAVLGGKWEEVGTLLGEKVNELVELVPWAEIGKKLGYYFNGAIQSLYYTLHTIDFNKIGQRIAELINNSLAQIDFTYLGRLLVRRVTAVIDLLIGGLSGINWGRVGESIKEFLTGAFDEATEWIDKYDWSKFGPAIIDGLANFLSGLDVRSVASSLSGFLQKAVLAAGDFVANIDFAHLIDIVLTFLNDTIQGLNLDSLVGVILKAATVALTSAFFQIPGVLATFAANLIDDINEFITSVIKALGFEDEFKRLGLDSIQGFLDGLSEKLRGIAEWMKTNVVDPVVTAVKNLFGIHSPSTVFAEIGGYLIDGFLEGIKNKIVGIASWINEHLFQPFKSAVESVFGIDSTNSMMDGYGQNIIVGLKNGIVNGLSGLGDWIYSTIWAPIVSGLNSIIAAIQNWWSGVTLFLNQATARINQVTGGGYSQFAGTSSQIRGYTHRASGGYVESGELFIAREAGPELVGTMNGRTAVANNDQIVSGIKEGVFEAVTAAMGGGRNDSRPVVIYLDGKEIARTTTKYQSQMARAGA